MTREQYYLNILKDILEDYSHVKKIDKCEPGEQIWISGITDITARIKEALARVDEVCK